MKNGYAAINPLCVLLQRKVSFIVGNSPLWGESSPSSNSQVPPERCAYQQNILRIKTPTWVPRAKRAWKNVEGKARRRRQYACTARSRNAAIGIFSGPRLRPAVSSNHQHHANTAPALQCHVPTLTGVQLAYARLYRLRPF